MKNITLDLSHTWSFIDQDILNKIKPEALAQNANLHCKSGKGSDFLGWVDLPSRVSSEEIKEIQELALQLNPEIEYWISIGIGGSYLGAKAVIEALAHTFDSHMGKRNHPVMLFAGQNISQDYLAELLDFLKDKTYGIIVISKSGTTTEPALTFRLLKKDLEEKIGASKAATRIIAITDAKDGALRKLAEAEKYKSFVIPDDVGGRYSVLTPVGLVPIALAGFDIASLVNGARDMKLQCGEDKAYEENIAAQYAALRYTLYKQGKSVEILENYHHKLAFFAEWWKQLFGESEGKEGKGLFPASVNFTTDLHSLGQYIQEGPRNLFETVLSVQTSEHALSIPNDKDNLDSLNYLAGKTFDEVNQKAELGTMMAHTEGQVPNIRIEVPRVNAYYLGQLIYFFEKACGISGYLLGVNPFDQPGVEAYKRNMFKLLGKPGS